MKLSELLTGPERWCKGHAAEDKDGTPCHADDAKAERFCLIGATVAAYPEWEERFPVQQKLANALYDVFQKFSVTFFNDSPLTKWEDVQRLLQAAEE